MAKNKSLEERMTAVETELAELRALAVQASEDSAAGQAGVRDHGVALSSFESKQDKILVVLERLIQTQEEHFAELGATQVEHSMQLQALSEEMQGVRSTQLEQQADIEKLQQSSMQHWAEMQDLRRTQLKHYADHKADAKALRGDVGTLKGDVGTLKGDVSEIKQGMVRLELAVGRLGGGPEDQRS